MNGPKIGHKNYLKILPMVVSANVVQDEQRKT
jgi:hypothetical protein